MSRLVRNILLSIIGTLWILSVTMLVSYGIWQINYVQQDPNTLVTACFDVAFTANTAEINMINTYPMDDYKGIMSTPYTFTIENKCDTKINYVLALDIFNTTDIDLEKVKISVSGSDSVAPVLVSSLADDNENIAAGVLTRKVLTTKNLNRGSYSTTIRIWIDENASNEVFNQKLFSKIVITSTAIK